MYPKYNKSETRLISLEYKIDVPFSGVSSNANNELVASNASDELIVVDFLRTIRKFRIFGILYSLATYTLHKINW